MVEKKPPRKKTLPGVETAVLAKSARRCTLCFYLKGDLTEKVGQISHLDDNPSNGAQDNLSWMCLEHHSVYDSKTKQHKNYTVHEVKSARDKLYELVAQGKHLTPAAAQPYLQAEADKKILRDFLQAVPSNGSIHFVRHTDFRASFRWERLKDIEAFTERRKGPEHEFLDPELEEARHRFMAECDLLLRALAHRTFPTGSDNIQAIPREWRYENAELFERAAAEIHAAADAVCGAYDRLVRSARKKLAV
jgi:hypothetical protein